MDRRTLLKLLGVGAGAAAVAGCVPDSVAPTTGDPAARDFAFASWSLADPTSVAGPTHLIETYQRATGTKITGVPIAYPDYVNQLMLKVRSGEFEGVAQLDISSLSGLAALGKLVDLGPQAKGVDYTDAALTTGHLNGKRYGLPWTTAAVGMLVNEEILRKVGADKLPETIDRFEELLTEIGKTGVIPYAASTKVAELKDMLIWLQTFGCQLIDGDKVTIADEAGVAALRWFKSLLDRKLIAPDVERVGARTLFAQGKTAMYDDALVGKDVVAKQSPDKNLVHKIAPYARPVLKAGDKPRAQQWGHLLVVVDGQGAQSAAKFARWATSDPNATVGYFKDVSLPPPTKSGLKSPAVTSDEFTTQFTRRVTATATPDPFWRFPQYTQMETAVSTQIQAALIGEASPEDALRQAAKAVEELM